MADQSDVFLPKARLLIATSNAGKVAEFRDLLADSGWQVVSPEEIGLDLEVEETGSTYAENARLKAEAFSRASGLAALADDSGLEVDALKGEPGALHHRHGWDGRDQEERIRILLDALKDVPAPQRTARFRAAIVVVLAGGEVIEAEGGGEGVIATQRSGSEGFGYDPVFVLPHLGKTMADLGIEEKNRVSHRAAAAVKIRQRLQILATSEHRIV